MLSGRHCISIFVLVAVTRCFGNQEGDFRNEGANKVQTLGQVPLNVEPQPPAVKTAYQAGEQAQKFQSVSNDPPKLSSKLGSNAKDAVQRLSSVAKTAFGDNRQSARRPSNVKLSEAVECAADIKALCPEEKRRNNFGVLDCLQNQPKVFCTIRGSCASHYLIRPPYKQDRIVIRFHQPCADKGVGGKFLKRPHYALDESCD